MNNFKKIAEDPVFCEIVKARIKFIRRNPFYGNIGVRLELIDATKWLGTAATDGRRLYYNRHFFSKLTKDEVYFVIGHEILHCVFDHVGRCGHRDKKIWNMAIDYLVNWVLINDNIGKKPDMALFSKRYDDTWSSDQIYNDILNRSVTIEVPLDEHLDVGDDDSSDQSGSGKKATVTVAPNDQDDGNGDDNGDEENDGTNGPVKVTPEELEKIRSDMKSAIIQAAQQAKSAGQEVPYVIDRMIDDLVEPKINWRDMITQTLKSCIKDDYSWNRPSNLSWLGDIIYPGTEFGNTIDVCVAIDVSGSIGYEQLRDFLSEVKGIMEEFTDFRLRIWSFDTAVHSYEEFNQSNIDEFLKWRPQGGGGTDFMCNWDFMKDPESRGQNIEQIEPEQLIMFTDGMPNDSWGDPNYTDTLFVIHGTDAKAPFGTTVKYEFQ